MEVIYARELYSRFIASMRAYGWTDADVTEYAEQVRIMMGKDGEAAMNIFPAGLYQSADHARASARECWGKFA